MNTQDLGQMAKQWLGQFVTEIDTRLAIIWDTEIEQAFGFDARQKALGKRMLVHGKSHNLAPSKRIRSAFVYNAYRLGKQPILEGVWQAAAAIELVHTALLMHDDFMDQDQLRRGQETSNAYFAKDYGEQYGNAMAVNEGDMVLSLGYETLMKCGLAPERVLAAMTHLQRTILQTAIGQAHDVTLGHVTDWNDADVLAVHAAKTGLYTYENPLMVGGLLAGLSEEVLAVLREYSRDGGIAFQLQDDILGVFGDSEKTGKSADSDLRQGKATLLILKALDRPEVQKVWGEVEASDADLAAAKQAIIDSGALDYNRKLARELAQKAVITADRLKTFDLDPEATDFIRGVASYMVEREV